MNQNAKIIEALERNDWEQPTINGRGGKSLVSGMIALYVGSQILNTMGKRK